MSPLPAFDARGRARRRMLAGAVLVPATLVVAVLPGAAGAGAAAAPAGASWSIQSTPNPGGTHGSALTAVSCPAASFCLAVGWKGNGGNGASVAEVWNGTSWSVQKVAAPAGATGSSLADVSCASTTACTAVGSYSTSSELGLPMAETWNGASWTVTPVPEPSGTSLAYLNGVSCTAAASCVAVGSDETASTALTMLAEEWNGKAWRLTKPAVPKGSTNGNLLGVSCLAVGGCTAVGSYGTPSNVVGQPLAEHWNGSSWSLRAAAAPKNAGAGSYLGSVSCRSASSCMAVGNASSSGTSGRVLAERWNGTAWSLVPAPDPAGRTYVSLGSVSCTSAGACEAAGYSEGSTGNDGLPLIERWNGSSWSISTVPLPAGGAEIFLNGMSCSAAAGCTSVGSYTGTAGYSLPLAERYAG